jgi:ABC-type multidrug transport system ATPase subunit
MAVGSRIACSHLRVDVAGAPAIDGLSFASTGDHVLVLGAARALFEAAAGLRPVARGELLVEGLRAPEAIRAGLAASAQLDPPLPGSWTVFEYAIWSARLVGHDRTTARSLAADALSRVQIASMAKSRLAAAAPSLRRATVLAAALATGATTLLVEDPTLALSDDSARPLARAFTRAVDDRRTVVFGARVPLESPIALAADEAIVVDGSDIAAQGAPAEIAAGVRTVALRVHGDLDAFRRAVEARGGHPVVAPGAASPAHVRVDLGPLAARDLVRIAAESNAVVLELRPLARPFA